MDAIKKRELRAEIQELNIQKHYIHALDLSPGFVTELSFCGYLVVVQIKK